MSLAGRAPQDAKNGGQQQSYKNGVKCTVVNSSYGRECRVGLCGLPWQFIYSRKLLCLSMLLGVLTRDSQGKWDFCFLAYFLFSFVMVELRSGKWVLRAL